MRSAAFSFPPTTGDSGSRKSVVAFEVFQVRADTLGEIINRVMKEERRYCANEA
jgi:hypothetical protein